MSKQATPTTGALQFALAIAARRRNLDLDPDSLPDEALARRLIECIGCGTPVDVGMYAWLLYARHVGANGLSQLALRPLLDQIRRDSARIEAEQER